MVNRIVEDIRNIESAIMLKVAELNSKKALLNKKLEKAAPKDVSSVNYDVERVGGCGAKETEEESIINIAKTKIEINELEGIIEIKQHEVKQKKSIILERLKDDEKEVFQLVYIDGRSYRNAGRELNMSKSAVFQRVRNIDNKLNDVSKIYNEMELNMKKI